MRRLRFAAYKSAYTVHRFDVTIQHFLCSTSARKGVKSNKDLGHVEGKQPFLFFQTNPTKKKDKKQKFPFFLIQQ